jgi:predicted secreted protein
MPSTGVNNGTLVTVYVSGTKILCSTSATLNVEVGTRDASCKDSAGWTDNLPATKSWSIDAEALFKEDASYGFSELFALQIARTQVSVKYTSNVSGDEYFHGNAYITSLSRTAPLEDNETYSCTFVGTGALTKATLT